MNVRVIACENWRKQLLKDWHNYKVQRNKPSQPSYTSKGENSAWKYVFSFLNAGLLLKERICSQQEQILSFECRPFQRGSKYMYLQAGVISLWDISSIHLELPFMLGMAPIPPIKILTLHPSRNISLGIFVISRASKGSGSSNLVIVIFVSRDSSTCIIEIAEILLMSLIPPKIYKYMHSGLKI